MNYSSDQPSSSSNAWAMDELQEPVPFEDFKFSFGLDPEFSMPLPLDDIPTTQASTSSGMDFLASTSLYDLPEQPNSLLDEQDQRTFSQFLDTFFMGPSSMDLGGVSGLDDGYLLPPLPGKEQDHQQHQQDRDHVDDDDELEERRRNSILLSLDQQKQKLHNRLNFLAASQSGSRPSYSNTPATTTATSVSTSAAAIATSPPVPSSSMAMALSSPMSTSTSSSRKRMSPCSSMSPTPSSKRLRQQKELLTEEEKRANHIASEQKRRNTIRTGFRDLTDIIPTLKNINNSKSTILFKAVDFIKYLDRRNRSLKEKVRQLELRLEVQGIHQHITPSQHHRQHYMNHAQQQNKQNKQNQQNQQQQHHARHQNTRVSSSPPAQSASALPLRSPSAYSTSSNTTTTTNRTSPTPSMAGLSSAASAALLAHKTQQQQLIQLQEQLQLHQRLLAQQHEMKERALQQHAMKLPPMDASIHRGSASPASSAASSASPSASQPKQGFRSITTDTAPSSTSSPLMNTKISA
ncbi:hypothetical protein BC940DRAFT_312611 [Gongronella butleri]|nr:hypothetical protein BC940DRAFT_312611 [Gongronella butleri]